MSIPTSIPDLNKKIFSGGQHQSAVIRLGQMALSNVAPAELLKEAASLITQVLSIESCLIWKLLEDGKNFLLVTGVGLRDGSVSRIQTPLELHSMKGFALTTKDPVVVEDMQQEKRFRMNSLSLDQAMSGASILIGTLEKPYGVLEVLSQQSQSFSQNDLYFLQSVANILGLVLQRVNQEEDQVAENQKLANEVLPAQFMMPSYSAWDRSEIKNRLIESHEKERLRLAQVLHDTPIQDLYGLIYQLDDLKDGALDSERGAILEEFRQTLHRVVNNLRAICRDLRPPSLSPFGLEVAIRDHAEKFSEQNPNIQVNLELMRDQQILSDSLRLSLFRIYQQAMHNVARHANATEVYVRFSWDEEMIILEVEDNGRGFEVPQQWMDLVHEDHFGFLGIAERVESIRGKLEIISAPGSGTLVRTLLPRS